MPRSFQNINLLDDPLSFRDVEATLSSITRVPLRPPLGADPWSRVATSPTVREWMKPLRERAEAEKDLPLPSLTDELRGLFCKTGDRATFERVYFERRRRLARAALGVLLGGPTGEKFLPSLVRKTEEVFAEKTWCLPAHELDARGLLLPIDLFAAESANLMAELLDLFGAVLPPSLKERIRARLRSEFFEPFARHPQTFWWHCNKGNWNAVCHQGVVGAALSQLDDARLLTQMLMVARRGLPHFLAGFTPDGGTSEGPGYWDYGFGRFAVLNEQLEQRTRGRLSLFSRNHQVRRIAAFGPALSLPGGRLVNFADGSAKGVLNPALLACLGKRLDVPECRVWARVNFARRAEEPIEIDAERCDLFHLGRLFLACPRNPRPPRSPRLSDSYFRDLGVTVAHGRDRAGHAWDFAAKAGFNQERHNHNDCGSYILNIDGEGLITEIGAPLYTRDFFIPAKRYGFLAARTLGHSLPIINGVEQAEGRRYIARVLSRRGDARVVSFAIDATHCYPSKACCREFVRRFLFDKREGTLAVRDMLTLRKEVPVQSAVVTSWPITIVENGAVIEGKPRLRLVLDPGTVISGVEEHGYDTHDIPSARALIQRIVLKPATSGLRVRLGFRATVA